MDKQKTNGFLIRDFPQELKDKAKHRAIDEGITLKDLVIAAIRDYTDRQKK